MSVDRQWVRTYLQQFDFESLFIEELGWDQVDLNMIPVGDEGMPYQAEAIAEKRGMVVYHCLPGSDGNMPDPGVRRKIDHQINSYSREHLIVYSDAAQQAQVWQWVRREKGKPLAPREYRYHISQDGERLVQKLEALAIDLEEEEGLSTVDVKTRAKKAFDVDKVTKKFYEQFQREHTKFLKFVTGIQEKFDQEWYASVMLNRLMFVYFLQKKGFLNGDLDYLQNRLKVCQQGRGDDEFYSFYRYFLLRLFHEGLGDSKRDSPELERLIGKIPYLNGGLFDVHELEERNPDIQIPDEAFEAIFEFFDAYDWHLDDRPLRNDNEINPDVLGYIFEKYINQKQMGAYYTKEDITEYISKNTIIPFLLDAAKKGCAIAFEPDGPVWRLLRENPERYIYEAVKKGVIKEDPKTKIKEVMALPAEIEVGIADVSQRGAWNRLAEAEYALPTELWREHVARRLRCLEIREKLASGEVCEVNDLITYNLDIRQFAQDVIEQCEGPELLRAFYKAISQISVLDPTCGSGAFLFAALNILEPLYDACLRRMKGFVEDLDRSEEKSRPEKFSDFRKILEQVAKHPNREYFILKSIILGNLYGVDIMEEAVEICKLRLFLKLVSQVSAKAEKSNYGLEPLPDIDFNIRAGNTLVGFATYDEVKKAVEGDGQQKLDLFSDMHMPRIEESAEVADRAFQMFRAQQTEHNMDSVKFKNAKAEVRRRLKKLNDELSRYLARQYGVNLNKAGAFEDWLGSHYPFHWFVEFYRIIKGGGFSVIVGNPPYVEVSKVRKQYDFLGYKTEKCGNLYALCSEKSYDLLGSSSRFGFVVQQPIVSTQRMESLRNLLIDLSSFILASTYDDRPSKLFDGINHARIALIISKKGQKLSELYVSSYQKWYRNERPVIFDSLVYIRDLNYGAVKCMPKLGSHIELRIVEKLVKVPKTMGNLVSSNISNNRIYYKITGVGHWFTVTGRAPKFFREGVESSSTREKSIFFESERVRDVLLCVMNSSLFYWFYQVRTNCRDFNPSDYKTFPLPRSLAESDLSSLAIRLQAKLDESSTLINVNHSKTGTVKMEQFRPREAKQVIDEIDLAIAKHYELNDEEIDFIVNYDTKYRMGLDNF